MIEAEWWEFEDADALAGQVADDIAFIIESAIEAKGAALLAVPGGKTPIPIFRSLAARKLDWPRVTLLPTDDRLVGADDPLSNFGLLRREFGTSGARLLPLVDGREADPAAAGRAADARLQELSWPLDLVWLGMGADGHTASILPGPDLEMALNGPSARLACGVTPDPLPSEAPVARVTLTRAALIDTRSLMLTINGAEKRAVAEQALADGPLSSTAIGRLLADADMPVDIFWMP